MSRPAALERRLGHKFARGALLEQALTHRSHGGEHNERLEFLGDGVLGCAVADLLYARFPGLSEGTLTRLRASLVREEALVQVASHLELGESLRMAIAERPPSVLADALEAVFGAVFLDGGYEAARKAIAQAFRPLLDRLDPDAPPKDAKTELQELLQARRWSLPEYRVRSVQGAAHRQSFEVECLVGERSLRTTGSGTTRQRAEQDAARAMLERIAKA